MLRPRLGQRLCEKCSGLHLHFAPNVFFSASWARTHQCLKQIQREIVWSDDRIVRDADQSLVGFMSGNHHSFVPGRSAQDAVSLELKFDVARSPSRGRDGLSLLAASAECGNDAVGKQFDKLINHFAVARKGGSPAVVFGLVLERFRCHLIDGAKSVYFSSQIRTGVIKDVLIEVAPCLIQAYALVDMVCCLTVAGELLIPAEGALLLEQGQVAPGTTEVLFLDVRLLATLN